MKLPECNARVEFELDQRRYRCAHPKVHAIDDIVTPGVCIACSHASRLQAELRQLKPIVADRGRPEVARPPKGDGLCFHLGELRRTDRCESCKGNVQIKVYSCGHLLHDETTIAYCRRCYDHEPILGKGGIREWAVGVVTAPRPDPTIERTLSSLATAGWTEPRLFVEPGSQIPGSARLLPKSHRDVTMGAWPNWLLGLTELVQRHPDADAYLMTEDDVVFCRSLRPWLDHELWPQERLGAISLFCSTKHGRLNPGWHAIDPGWTFAGAQAMIFPPMAARMLITHPTPINHRRLGRDLGRRDTDAIVGLWAKRAGLDIMVPSPSLADHVGETSSLGHGRIEGSGRTTWRFPGESFSASGPLSTWQVG